ncbi:MAG: hypothetical protein ACSLEM_05915 [Candidatus Malihini olakiniferum]
MEESSSSKKTINLIINIFAFSGKTRANNKFYNKIVNRIINALNMVYKKYIQDGVCISLDNIN